MVSQGSSYLDFLNSKRQLAGNAGFDPVWMPDCLFDFQKILVEWAIRKGRAALFEDCGLGKTLQQLVWAENVVRKTNRPVLVLTPLAVGPQTVAESHKFGMEASRSSGGSHGRAGIVVTNYEKLHLFEANDFAGVVCDESGILKNFDGVRRDLIVEFLRTRPYRLLCTATAAPNDYVELGNSSEALGEMGYADMITRFFRKENSKADLGWGRAAYAMRPHAERDFWRWVCSWSRAIRRPADLGCPNGSFDLPRLDTREHVIQASTPQDGMLFDLPAVTLAEQRAERRRSLSERCELVATLVSNTARPAVCWCHLNEEGDALEKMIPGAIQVSGRDSDEAKEEKLTAFTTGQARVLVTKPVLAGFGLNWQHCSHQTFFPSHSFEQFYQAVRRSWRFGQKNTVVVDVVTSEGERGVLANLQRKTQQAEVLFQRLVELMNDSLHVQPRNAFTRKEALPSWL
jgi:hypothetical protein